MLNEVSGCFSLFLYFSLPTSQYLPILLSLSPNLFKFTVSKATAIQSQHGGEMNSPLICFYYCPVVLSSFYVSYTLHMSMRVRFAKCLSMLHQLSHNQLKPGSQSMPLIYPHWPPPVSNDALFTVCHCMTNVACLMNSSLIDFDDRCKWREHHAGEQATEKERERVQMAHAYLAK